MPRSRNIKPGIMANDQLAMLSPITRLLFIYLWMLADREGRLEDRPNKIGAQALPYDRDTDVDDLLNQLAGYGFITRYIVGALAIIQITNFEKHQSPHVRESASELPKIGQGTSKALIRHNLDCAETSPGSPDCGSLIPDCGFLIPEAVANATVASKQATEHKPACPIEEIIVLYHASMPLNPKVKTLSDKRRKSIRARWKDAADLTCKPFGYKSQEDGLKAWRRYFEICAESDFLTGRAKPAPNKPPFVATIDFLISPDGFTKCLENYYHREVTQ